MPGTPRRISETGFYHVVVKGNNGRIIFEDNQDRFAFLDLMAATADKHAVRYHAWCLMGNHVHMLVEDDDCVLPKVMSMINRGYAEHYKRKNGHEGTLYKGRYWSEPIENDAYAVCAMRYIHHNPQAAGICLASQYAWSSIGEYLGRPELCTTERMLDICGGIDGFIAFHRASMTAKPFPTSKLRNHMTGDEAYLIAKSIVGEEVMRDTERMPLLVRNQVVAKLHTAGFTLRQIASFCALSTSKVQAIVKCTKPTVGFVHGGELACGIRM